MAKYPAHLKLNGIVVSRSGMLDLTLPWRDVVITELCAFVDQAQRKVDATVPKRFSWRDSTVGRVARRLQHRQIKNDLRQGRHEVYWRASGPWFPLTGMMSLVLLTLLLALGRAKNHENNIWRNEVSAAMPLSAKIELGLIIAIIAVGLVSGIGFLAREAWTWYRAWRIYPSAKSTSQGLELFRQDGQSDYFPWQDLSATNNTLCPLQFRNCGRRLPFFPKSPENHRLLWLAATGTSHVIKRDPTLDWKATRRLLVLVNFVSTPLVVLNWLAIEEPRHAVVAVLMMSVTNALVLLLSPWAARLYRISEDSDRKCRKKLRRAKHTASKPAAMAYF